MVLEMCNIQIDKEEQNLSNETFGFPLLKHVFTCFLFGSTETTPNSPGGAGPLLAGHGRLHHLQPNFLPCPRWRLGASAGLPGLRSNCCWWLVIDVYFTPGLQDPLFEDRRISVQLDQTTLTRPHLVCGRAGVRRYHHLQRKQLFEVRTRSFQFLPLEG